LSADTNHRLPRLDAAKAEEVVLEELVEFMFAVSSSSM
jgi:hypothetical protein